MSCGGFTVPKGYRFHPSDEELLSELELKNQCKDSQFPLIIPEIDVCKYEPRQLPELAFTGRHNLVRKFFFIFFWFIKDESSWGPQGKCHFFTPRDYKYKNSSRSNRTTEEGFYKITGKDRPVKAPGSNVVIGRMRILTFYLRGGPRPQRTGWVIHEYYLIQERSDPPMQIGDFVLCCLKYKADDSGRDKDAPSCNRGNSSYSMASNVLSHSCSGIENQAEENGNDDQILNGKNDEAETGGGVMTEEEEEEYRTYQELEDALQVPMGDPHEDPCRTDQTNRSNFVQGQPDGSNSSDMVGEGYSQLESDFDSFQANDCGYAQPSINGGPRDFSNGNNLIVLDPLLYSCKDIEISLAEFSDTDIENQPKENGNDDQILNGKNDEAETGGGVITEEEEEEKEYQTYQEPQHALQVPIGNPHEDPCRTDQTNRSNFVRGQPDGSSSSDMVEEPLDDPEYVNLLFDRLQPLQESPIYNPNVPECRKRTYPFEYNDPSLLKKNNISTNDDDIRVSNSASSENQAANVIPKGYSQQESDFDSFWSIECGYAQPSTNGGPRDFSNGNNLIVLDPLPYSCKDIDISLAEFSVTDIDGGTGVTNDGNTKGVHESVNDYPPLAFGASAPL